MKNDVDQFDPLYKKCRLLHKDGEEKKVHVPQKEGRLIALVKSCVGTAL